jgi:hypothetical protein
MDTRFIAKRKRGQQNLKSEEAGLRVVCHALHPQIRHYRPFIHFFSPIKSAISELNN